MFHVRGARGFDQSLRSFDVNGLRVSRIARQMHDAIDVCHRLDKAGARR
jgi:hypothetical protein